MLLSELPHFDNDFLRYTEQVFLRRFNKKLKLLYLVRNSGLMKITQLRKLKKKINNKNFSNGENFSTD